MTFISKPVYIQNRNNLFGEKLYLPQRFKNEDPAAALTLIQKYPLATLISVTAQGPFISHLPLVAEQTVAGIVLYGHLARGNPHSRLLQGQSVYAIFHGPNAYISPQWYENNDVPTWNYAVVHAQGTCTLLEDRDGIFNCLKKLSAAAEAKMPTPWEFWLPEDLSGEGVVEKAITGFSIQVTSLQSKFKMNQSRSEADLKGAVQALKQQGTDSGREVAALMTKNWKLYNKGI